VRPIVAIVGRPNVGKSTLFNKITGKRIAIVEDTPGVTRDRIYSDAEWLDNQFILIDTGGIEPFSEDVIISQMRAQAEVAIDTADVIIFIVDAKGGITPADLEVATMLRKTSKPIVLAVNKIDDPSKFNEVYEFYNLGIGDPIGISAAQGLAIGDLLDEVVAHFKELDLKEDDDDATKIAIIGKPNVGKSSLVNKLVGEDRVIVSDIPGTTRDAIDTPLEVNGNKYVLIDTAGMRKKSKVKEDIERYSVLRAITAIERSDVCIIMIDAEEGVTEQDTKIAGLVHEAGKGVIIAINKWDLIEKDDKTMNEFRNKIRANLSFISYAPIIFISVKTGQRVQKLIDLVNFVHDQNSMRIQTGVLNDIISDAIIMNQPPVNKGKKLKIFYTTQVSTKPPTFVFFVNYTEALHFSYERYLENQIRSRFGLEGTPIRFIWRPRNDDEEN
jgi:GTP-binding protein